MLENKGNALDYHEGAIDTFFDFQNVFITVNHNILLDTLYKHERKKGIAMELLKVTWEKDLKIFDMLIMNQIPEK